MTQEDKELLLKDLCARQMYNVKCQVFNDVNPYTLSGILHNKPHGQLYFEELDWKEYDGFVNVEYCKPYLCPLSSMTEEQEKELITITDDKFRYMWGDITNAIPRKNTSEWGISENAFIKSIKEINSLYIWLLKNHFDIYGLIPLGLAKDATGLGIY